MPVVLLVALGGAIGASARFLLPRHTMFINILGSLLMGVLVTLIVDKQIIPAEWRPFLCVGLLGGFTTFSSFSMESITLMQQGNLVEAMTYVLGSVGLGLVACFLGVQLGRMV